MQAPRTRNRGRLSVLVTLALSLTGLSALVAAPAQAASTTVVISEVFGANSATNLYNQDFVELHNTTGSPVSLAGMSVQYRSATSGTGASSKVDLSGNIPANGYVLVGGAVTSGGTSIPTPDFSNTSMNLSGTNGVAILANTQTLLTNGDLGGPSITGTPGTNALIQDLVGFGTANIYETAAAPAPSNTTVIKRTVSDADNNSTEFSSSTTGDPTNSAPEPESLAVTSPGDKTGIVGVAIAPFDLAATGGTPPYTWTKVGMPPGITVSSDGTVSGTPTKAGSYDPVVEATDSVGESDTETFSFDIAANPSLSTIASVQGTGATTPVDGQLVKVEGEVTASYPTGGLNGFYIQTPGPDTTPNASDGIFVYGGSSGFTTYPDIGDSVRVIGTAGEFSGATQITSADAQVEVIADLPGAVVAKTSIPGADCSLPGTTCDDFPALNEAREKVESEALQPSGDFTVTDVYDFSPFYAYEGGTSVTSSMFGEIGLAANSDQPLVTPTEIIDAQATAAKNKRIRYNNAHRIVLDDGSSLSYNSAANTGSPFPWLTASHHVRVGAAVTFPEPVVLTFGFNTWRLLPSTRVVGEPTGSQPQVEQTRAEDLVPEDVGGDLTLATFNVLNFFPTTGAEYVAAGGGNACTYFNDRAGNPITNNRCGNPTANTGNGPRGAADEANLARQRDKIVAAINAMDADVVSLEELENSAKFGKDRDFAINALVTALNADAGPGTWAAVPSPAASALPPLAEQDVIRNGFIYKPATVALVGKSVVLADQSSAGEAFEDAREPLAQAFKRVGTANSDAMAVIVNHFKSKGSGTPDPDGQGNANDSRILQAHALAAFADSFKAQRGITRVFLTGDLNSYSEEDPIQVLEAAGYTNLESTFDPTEESYNFDGQMGSLDHVLANDAALADVEDVDLWEINANESVYYEYSRFNYNVTNLYDDGPFRSSDHNPELVGIDTPEPGASTEIQILGTNDFHGRIANESTSGSAGAGVMAGAVKQLRTENPNTVFAAAGDLIGASTFESFILNDKPTIDALNEAGLDVSSVGNHEFDQGYADLVDRVMAAYHADDNPDGGAEWQYLGANVRFKANDNPALPATWTKDFGGLRVGFVGTVTEHLPELVSPGGITDIKVTDIVEETNAAADDLVDNQGADLVVMLVHEGAPMTSCTDIGALGAETDFGSIVQGVNENVDAIVSGHTHLAYNCSFPVEEWVTEGRAVTERPVVSAGQYGTNLNQIVFTIDNSTGEVSAKTQSLLPLKSCTNSTACTNYPVDGPTQAIVDAALAEAAPLGAAPLGEIAGPIRRGYLANGTTENRGVESALGNLVAEAQRWAMEDPEFGGAQIGFMNPGGLRADMLGLGSDPYPRTLTYKQAAEVQPFANGLVNMQMTGAQIKAALEQQWQPAGSSRPFLKLGASKGFTYTSDPDAAQGSRITGMWLNGVPINPATSYSVTVNSFLATGGDNFPAFNVPGQAQYGQTDLQAMVEYLDEVANTGEGDDPLPVPTEQNGVHVNFPPAAPASYAPGDTVAFDVSGWSMSTAGDPKDSEVEVTLDGTSLGTFPLDNTIQAALPGFDATGTTSVAVELPADAAEEATSLLLTGATTGTEVRVPVDIDDNVELIQILGTNDFHGRIANEATSGTAGAGVMAGAVNQLRTANPNTAFVAAGDLIGASTFESFILQDEPTIEALNAAGLDVSAAGNHEFDQGYADLAGRVQDLADFEYIAANVRKNSDDSHALAPTWTQEFGSVKVGYVGAVTEHLPELVSPGGISEIHVTDIVDEVNDAAADLKADGADLVVMLVHEGAPMTNCTQIQALAANTDFGSIVQGVSDDIDAIVSGHTHLAYNCSFPVPGWVTEGRAVTERPVVSAGQYATNLNQIVFTVDDETGEVQAKTQALLALKSCTNNTTCTNYPVHQPTQDVVDAALAEAAPLGAAPLGQIAEPIRRGYLANGTTENRGAESALGNLVAEAQRWRMSAPEFGAAEIGFMNPGGLRQDMLGSGAVGDPYPRTLTYKQAAEVQPFANGLVNMQMTGAQIKAALEQQWQPAGASRPFLKLGISEGFTYTSVPPPAGSPDGTKGTITGMWLDGTPIGLTDTYSVTVNSFLATGGDNFPAFNVPGQAQYGQTDLQAMVDYLDEFANTGEGDDPLPVPSEQNGVHVVFPDGAPGSYEPGQHVQFDVSGWSFTSAPQDTQIDVQLGGETIGTATLDNTAQAALPGFDVVGTASVDVVLPADTADGGQTLMLVGPTTGTEIPVEVTVDAPDPVTPELTVTAPTMTYGASSQVTVAVEATGHTPTGTVQVRRGAEVLGTGTVSGGVAKVQLPARSLPPGNSTLSAVYSGDADVAPATKSFTQAVAKAKAVVDINIKPGTFKVDKTKGKVVVRVSAAGVDPVTGKVEIKVKGQGTQKVTLVDGKAVLTLDVFNNKGQKSVKVTYLGNSVVAEATEKAVITVKP